MCLLEELEGKAIDPSCWDGYHPKVYNQQVNGDALVHSLCEKLQQVNVKDYSLEMQVWWRDHQKADAARLEKEIKAKATKKAKVAAMKKLSAYERKLLGLID